MSELMDSLQLEASEIVHITEQCLDEVAETLMDLTDHIDLPVPLEIIITNSSNQQYKLTLSRL